MSVILITGGARSGKSRLAEDRARAYKGVLYIATARALDDEMRARIARHRLDRPASWDTFEGSRGLAQAVGQGHDCVLLDCVTNLVTNFCMDQPTDWEQAREQDVQEVERLALSELTALVGRVRARGCALIMVNNEVGLGLVPEYPLGRAFRDIAGRIGQRLAALSDEVYFCVSGIPMRIK
ncbi:bifunctional adenosylcobinamide kinase/adenosylcobinamide-phosphate guanylyltransferase [Bacillota bacterium Meth-B3]